MLTFNYRYRIYPDATTEQRLIEWMEICRRAYNYALGEIKDWCNSRKCFPRFKKVGQFKSLLFPQFKENPVTNLHC
ncbi:helix-turn-helix domain-containing protein [Coleofasciculus sp. D1-CHI-01]|uniref:helix-turn-helix domain-containing protein n=1 Tax=Coleofasciculus sp. D1-CHI-01 TaxID=3068482 RepID=UPI00406282C9